MTVLPGGIAADGAAARIKAKALEIGFDAAGVAAIEPLEAHRHYEAWLAAGRNGEMAYLAKDRSRRRRADPAQILPDVRAVICVALCYEPAQDPEHDRRLGRIARYAAGEDYHRVMIEKLDALAIFVNEILPGARALSYCDTGAILERGWSERAGLGWIGKHSGLLSTRLGSWMVLGELLVDRALEPDAPATIDHCGTCRRCIDACPTGAIVAPHEVDARLCISYLTIELHGPIPRELRPLIGDWIFGCDICQEVCPWNRFAPPAREARLHARSLEGWTLERFLALDEAGFAALFAASPIRRARRAGFLRNVCVALGNRGEASAVSVLVRALREDRQALVRGHAAWALGEIGRKSSDGTGLAAALREALDRDPDSFVREEAAAAIACVTR